MVLFQALGITLFLTSLSKVFFGRHRPNFYAMCNYKGYRDAVASGDFTAYPFHSLIILVFTYIILFAF